MTLITRLLSFLLSLLPGNPEPNQQPDAVPAAPEIPAAGDPPWLRLARADLGIREAPGADANPDIMRAWQYCDYEPPAGDETAWCSAKCNEWLQRAGFPGTRQPNARSWERYGKQIGRPVVGCIAVLWRGSPTSWQGHVALYMGPGRPGHVKLLGGNQGNAVSIAEFPASQVLCYRMPVTGANSRTLKASTVGLVGDTMTATGGGLGALAEAAPDLMQASDMLQTLGQKWPAILLAGILLGLAARMVVIYARMDDFKKKAA